MDVSIIIVNYRSKELVRECVKSFLRSKPRCTFEIIVVDNGKDEGLREMLDTRFPQVSYLRLYRNFGLPTGNNAGLRIARGRYVMITNPDITALSGSLDALHTYMEEHPQVGIAGPQLLNPDGTIQQSYYRFYRPWTPVFRRLFLGQLPFGRAHVEHVLMKDADPALLHDVDWLLGACLFVRRTHLDDVGGMDERFFLYFEDTDWCKRFWSRAYEVHYVHHAKMYHLFKRDSARTKGLRGILDSSARVHIASGIKYFLKHRFNYERSPKQLSESRT